MKKNIIFILLLLALPSCHNLAKKQLRSQEPITVYSHGYLCNKWVAHLFHTSIKRPNKICPHAFIIGPMKSFNYNDFANPMASHLGQDKDIKRLHEACKAHEQVILVGTSRGASAIINYLGVYKPTNVIAAVVESPFDHLDNIAENLIATRKIFKCMFNKRNKKDLKEKIRKTFFRNYKEDGIQPIHTAAHIPKEIPVLLISSDQDTLIPAWSTKNIYDSLRQSGHKKTHLLACKNGVHGKILWSKDGKTMRNVVHAFYKQHNVPHYEPWAQEGYIHFMQCQDTLKK